MRPVSGSAFDFRRPRTLRRGDILDDDQLVIGAGYDHNFVIDRGAPELAFVARVADPGSARWLEVLSTEPGVQLHLGQHLSGRAKGGGEYRAHSGLALETQHYPDTPNHPAFPSTLLRAGEQFTSRTEYRFGGGTLDTTIMRPGPPAHVTPRPRRRSATQ